MRYRSALNRCWTAVSLIWIAWCLYWPFYARRYDFRAIEAETADTYKICLEQKGMTAVACAADRDAHTKLDERVAWPGEQNLYQSFAGKTVQEALSFLILLCLFPVVFGYMLIRVVLEMCLWFARLRPQDAPIHHWKHMR